MIIKLKCGDEFVQVDSELSSDEIDTFEKIENVDLEDTLELEFDSEVFNEQG